MSKLVVINLEKGNMRDGFAPVTAQIWETNHSRPTQFTGSLPAAPQISESYKRFQLIYQAVYQRHKSRSQLQVEAVGLNNVGQVDFSDVCQLLYEQINAWLNSNSFRPIDQQLRARLALDEEFQVVIETSDYFIRRLPWHLWNFFEDYQSCEVALGTPSYEKVHPLSKNTTDKVKILSILGNSEGIDVQQDRALLEKLPDASTVFLVEPSRHELDKWLWETQGWDILFFAGHSQSDGDVGQIHINKTHSLTIPELRNALKYAISRGLRLAIFNSCDGLGLARQLADLQIPQIIVMRENVPDVIAQEFLKYFLTAFSGGQSFYSAVRYARERLQGLEDDFPGASWLPVICQNSAVEPPTWQELWGKTDTIHKFKLNRRSLQAVLMASVAIASLVVGVRSSGMMQNLELSAFDSIMRTQPDEGIDQRLLVITVTEADIQAQKQRQKSSLSDEALDKLLRKLELYQPRVIGLDIYHDFPVEPQYPDLADRLGSDNSFITICKVNSGKKDSDGVSPPPGIPIARQGFSDVSPDRDLILRRQLLAMTPSPSSLCKTHYSFSFQLARKYLEKEGIKFQITTESYLQLGKVVFKPLEVPTGGYQKFKALGHQVLLNYHSSKEIAQQLTLSQVLNGQFNPDLVRNRIVLIGVDAESVKDSFLTPYSVANMTRQEVPGVMIQAQMVHQILRAVKDDQPLLWVWSTWGEVLWIWGWSFVGGMVVFYRWQQWQQVLIVGTTLVVLYGCCFILFLYGGWVPLVPSVLTLILTYSFGTFYLKVLIKYNS